MRLSTSLPRLVRGAVRHPWRAGQVLAWRWRQDPARVLDGIAAAAPAALRRPTARLACLLRQDDRGAELWAAGRWSEAVAELPAGKRRQRYRGEMDAVRLAGVSVQTGAGVRQAGPPVPGRILHVVTNALPLTQAGYTIRTHAIVRAQRDAGLDPQVVTRWGWPALNGVLDAGPLAHVDGIVHHRLLPAGPVPERADVRLRRNADTLTALADRQRAAVLHAATPYLNGSPALVAARRLGLPLVYEVRGFQEDTWAAAGPGRDGSDRYRWTRDAEVRIATEADAVVTLAATMRDELVARGVPARSISVVPNAVDAALLSARPDQLGFRRALGIGAHELVVGSVSSLTGYEGFATLLRAIGIARQAGIAVRGLLVGQGPARADLLRLRAELGLVAAVVIAAPVPPAAAPEAIAALDALCVPRIDAPVCRLVTPLKIVEAMALGVPVIASDLPALSEVLLAGAAGRLVPPDRPAALAAAIAELADDRDRARVLAEAARREVARTRTWQGAAQAYRALYERIGSCRPWDEPRAHRTPTVHAHATNPTPARPCRVHRRWPPSPE